MVQSTAYSAKPARHPSTPATADQGPHEEALARCEYLIETRKAFGLVTGPAGAGKSELLRALATSALRLGGPDPILIDATHLDGISLIRELCDAFSVSAWSGDAHDRLRFIRDRLEGLAACEASQLVLIDHLDEALPDALAIITHLLRVTARLQSLTVIAAARELQSTGLASLQRDLGWIRIELQTLNGGQTAQSVRRSLRDAGRHERALAGGAAAELHTLTGGNPRQVQRLVELALLASEAEASEAISTDSIRSAAEELAVATLR
jgi:type II secretory pathway predicted ATPase ExeA